MSVTATRKPKWQPSPPPPPSPKILNFPRRHRRRTTKTAPSSNGGKPPILRERDYTDKLEALLDKDRKFMDNSVPDMVLTEEKWKFQAEILRAECNFLRMEREFALKKLDRNRTQMEKTLKSSVEALVLGRKKTHQGNNVNTVLEEEIEDLEEKLVDFQKNTSNEAKIHNPESESTTHRKFVDVEILRSQMETLSRGMVEYGSKKLSEENNCSGGCKSILRKIMEQVRSETEQWSQMQEMVRQVRQEMEELERSREFWEDRALDSEFEIRSLHSLVEEWRQKAMRYETKAKEIETELSSLRGEFHKLKKEGKGPIISSSSSSTLSLGAQIAKEKLASSTRYTHKTETTVTKNGLMSGPSSLPFREIGNSLSPKVRHKSSTSTSTSTSRGMFCSTHYTS